MGDVQISSTQMEKRQEDAFSKRHASYIYPRPRGLRFGARAKTAAVE